MGSKTSGRVTAAPRLRPLGWTTVAMRELEAGILCAVRSNCNVLITGENVVGRTSVAHRIHGEGRRAAVSMVVAGSPGALDSLDTLDRALLEASPEGAVLLEKPERLSPEIQSRLHQFVERPQVPASAGQVVARGSQVRFITATSSDLFALVRGHQSGESLFYRLNAIHLVIPPLRDRAEDIPALLQQFLSACAAAPIPLLSTATRQQLVAHPWPGNLRSCEPSPRALASLDRPRVEPDDLPPGIRR